MSLYKPDYHADENGIADDVDKIASAIQIWSWMQQRPTSVKEAAAVFNVEPKDVIHAIKEYDSSWLYLDGPDDDYSRLMICHEGE